MPWRARCVCVVRAWLFGADATRESAYVRFFKRADSRERIFVHVCDDVRIKEVKRIYTRLSPPIALSA